MTINKTVYGLGFALIVLLTAGLIYFINQPSEQTATTSPKDISIEGKLIKNNPGLRVDAWHLSYEAPGAPGLVKEVSFDDKSICINGKITRVCTEVAFEQGQGVKIDGVDLGTEIYIKTLTFQPQAAAETTALKLYFYNPDLDQGSGGTQCTSKGLVSVQRTIPKTQRPLTEAINLLLQGVTSAEKAQGLTSEFPLPGVTLKSAVIQDNIATLTFNDPENKTSGGSCRISIMRNQIEATAKQFPSVHQVHVMPAELFQP